MLPTPQPVGACGGFRTPLPAAPRARRGRLHRWPHGDGDDEAAAPAAHGLDVALRLAGVAQGFAGLGHGIGQPLHRRKLVRIEVRQQLLRGHGAPRMLDEIHQQLDDLY